MKLVSDSGKVYTYSSEDYVSDVYNNFIDIIGDETGDNEMHIPNISDYSFIELLQIKTIKNISEITCKLIDFLNLNYLLFNYKKSFVGE